MLDTWTDENGAIHQDLGDGITMVSERGDTEVSIICRDNTELFNHLCEFVQCWSRIDNKPLHATTITKNGFGDDIAIFKKEVTPQ